MGLYKSPQKAAKKECFMKNTIRIYKNYYGYGTVSTAGTITIASLVKLD